MISYTGYNKVVLKLFILEDFSSFSSLLPPTSNKAEIIQENTRISNFILESCMIKYLKFSKDSSIF